MLWIAIVACVGTEPVADSPPPRPKGPDVLLVTLDTTRADRIGAYGDPLAKTPALDALAADGALFRTAITPVPLTLPAHASILTGRYPSRHGLRDNGGYRLPDAATTLAEQLGEADYQTAAFVGAYVLDGAWGLDQGFATYGDDFHPVDVAQATSVGDVQRPGREVVAEAMAWWEATEGPRFLWVHLYDPHRPYEPSTDWSGDPYRGEVFGADRALRPLFEVVGPDALVVVAGDHGESLWDDGELEHGVVLNRSVLRVPLIVRPPGGIEGDAMVRGRPLPARPDGWAPVEGLGPDGLRLDAVPDEPDAARVVEEVVSLVDVMPTVLAYAGLECADCDGRSLRAAVDGKALDERPVFAESVYPYRHYGWAPAFAVVDGPTWTVRTDVVRSYDAAADPWLTTPLAATPEAHAGLIERWSEGWDHLGAGIDADTMAQLAALGYASAAVEPRGDLAPADPALLHRLALAQGRMASDPEGAEKALRALVADDPRLVDAWFSIGTLRLAAADADGALAAYERVVDLAPGHLLALDNIVAILRGSKRYDEALEAVDVLIALNPHDARWHRHKVDILGRQERPGAVSAAAEAGLVEVPDDPYLHYMRGLALVQIGQPEGALAAFASAREHGSVAPDLGLWEGQAHQALGQVDEAAEAFHAYAREHPDDLRPVVAAGTLLAEHDRCNDALPYLLTALERGVRDPRVLQTYRECGGVGY